MRSDSDAAYRLQGWRNVLNSRNELADAMSRVRLANIAREAALREARRTKDHEIIEEMRDLVWAIGNGNTRGYKESKELVSYAHGFLGRQRAREAAELTVDMAHEANPIFASHSGPPPIGTRTGRGAAVDRSVNSATTALDKAATVQSAANRATTMSEDRWTTDFQSMAISLAAPYIETLLAAVSRRIDGRLECPQWGKTAVDIVGRAQKGVGATLGLGKTLHWFAVDVPASVEGGLAAFADPGKALLKAVTLKIVGQGLPHATDAVVPLSKLLQPLASIASLLRQYPKIDAMHALHQRLARTSACRDAAFQIVDKWETALVNQVGGGNQVFAFINAMKNIFKAGQGHAVTNPASVLLAIARGEAGTERDRNDAFLILATLCGGGHGRRGIDKAVTAIVSGESGAKKIKSLI